MGKGVFLAASAAAIVGVACTAAVLDVRQPVRPAPTTACLTAALESSQDVAVVRKTIFHYGYSTTDFVVPDSTAKANPQLHLKAGQRLGQMARYGEDPASERPPGDTVILQFASNGADVNALAALAARVLHHVQGRCAPDESTAPTCAFQGRSIPC